MNDLYLFLLNDTHDKIVECHKYEDVDIDFIDITPHIIYEASEESVNFRKEKGGYHLISFLYEDENEIVDNNFIEQFESFLRTNKSFTPDERCLEMEYYMFGILTRKFDYLPDDMMDELNVLLLNQVVGFDDEGEGILNLRTTCSHNMDFYDNIEEIIDNLDAEESSENEDIETE